MSDITAAPDFSEATGDRVVACEIAVGPSFQLLVANAVMKGWPVDEVSRAVLNLALAQVAAQATVPTTGEDLEALARSTP